jgi:SAM-dependent methyltransferase
MSISDTEETNSVHLRSKQTAQEVEQRAALAALSTECPACGANCSGPPLSRYTVAQAAAHFCPPSRDAERNRRLEECVRKLWQGEECFILRCGQCGFAFGYPFVGGDEEYYSILHEQHGYPAWRWDYDIAMREAVSKREGGKILDIGAGVGNFLRRMSDGWSCFAVESTPTMKANLEKHQIQVFDDIASAVETHSASFQVVTIFQVLEHIADFRSVLQQCRRLLCPGGQLVITVPDGDAMIRQEELTGCPDMPPNHINKWTPRSLSHVLREVGFETGEAVYEPASWRNLRAAMHLRVIADATRPHSISAQAYRIKEKRLRVPVLACLGAWGLVRMLPALSQLRLGGGFAMIGERR